MCLGDDYTNQAGYAYAGGIGYTGGGFLKAAEPQWPVVRLR